ncbi:phosphopantetheine-binding protein [Paenibacillus sp. FSL R5-0341]|uniref:acyl carrier protein n=1 Tax=Paenibacillus sp. FSL R5-0341 TaxID=2921636 RepID=UPI0030D60C61
MSDFELEVRSKLQEIVGGLTSADVSEINDNVDLIQDIGLNSIDMIQLIVIVEQKFQIEIPAEDMIISNFQIYGKVIEYILEKVKVKGGDV